jgi:hypothetical protein
MSRDLHLLTLLGMTVAIGFVMVAAGILKSGLEWKHRSRFCPSCGRQIQGRSCGCTS